MGWFHQCKSDVRIDLSSARGRREWYLKKAMILIVPENLSLRVRPGSIALPGAVCAMLESGFAQQIRVPGGKWQVVVSMERFRFRGARSFLIRLE
jgi:hypothetical protein